MPFSDLGPPSLHLTSLLLNPSYLIQRMYNLKLHATWRALCLVQTRRCSSFLLDWLKQFVAKRGYIKALYAILLSPASGSRACKSLLDLEGSRHHCHTKGFAQNKSHSWLSISSNLHQLIKISAPQAWSLWHLQDFQQLHAGKACSHMAEKSVFLQKEIVTTFHLNKNQRETPGESLPTYPLCKLNSSSKVLVQHPFGSLSGYCTRELKMGGLCT